MNNRHGQECSVASVLALANEAGVPRLRRQWTEGRSYRNIPGFAESLRRLLFVEGYSFVDVGLMFGMSREMVRLAASACGIGWNDEDGGTALRGTWVRVWDDTEHRFRPIKGETIRAEANERRRDGRRTWRVERREEIVRALQNAQVQQDTPLTISQMAAACGHKGSPNAAAPFLVARWGRTKGHACAGMLAEIRAAAGLTARARGGAGHTGEYVRRAPRRRAPQIAQRATAIRAMRAGGMKLREIAAVLGLPISTITNDLYVRSASLPLDRETERP